MSRVLALIYIELWSVLGGGAGKSDTATIMSADSISILEDLGWPTSDFWPACSMPIVIEIFCWVQVNQNEVANCWDFHHWQGPGWAWSIMKPPHRLDVVQEVVFQERHCNCCILKIAQDASAVSNLLVFPPLVSQWGSRQGTVTQPILISLA